MDRADPRWADLQGGYCLPYDPRPALDQLAMGDASAWAELWQELYHQGDVGTASYAAVPDLVRLHRSGDWNTFALVATVEEARREAHNPPVPAWLRDGYDEAWRRLFRIALADLPDAAGDELIAAILAVCAFAKGRPVLGRMALLTEDECAAMLDAVDR